MNEDTRAVVRSKMYADVLKLALFLNRGQRDDFDRQAAAEPVRPKKAGARRNGPCPCGSGRKFKKCCLKGE